MIKIILNGDHYSVCDTQYTAVYMDALCEYINMMRECMSASERGRRERERPYLFNAFNPCLYVIK